MPDMTKCNSDKVKIKKGPEDMEVGLARCNSVSRRAFVLTSPPFRGSNNKLFIWPIYFSEANTICLTYLVSSTGGSSENPYQVVEHHLVEGEHVATLRDGALEKIKSLHCGQVPPHLEESVTLW